MFTIQKRPAHWWPVSVAVPVDGGKVETQTFELKLLRPGNAEWQETWKLAPDGAGIVTTLTDRQLFDRYVVDWRAIRNEAGEAVPFKPEHVDALLDTPGVPAAFGTALGNFFRGMPETVAGNSAASPGGGPEPSDADPTLRTSDASSATR
jgi:hypothetical protein